MSNDILLYKLEGKLVIKIAAVSQNEKPTATIISYNGETIETFSLTYGINNIDTTKYSGKNYSIRIKNGNNILVQKI